MRYQVKFLILSILIGLASVSVVHGASVSAFPSISVSDTPSFPYDAEITGDSVYVRTGPGVAYYEFGKLYKKEVVKVVGERDGVWSMIEPLEGSFSWISAQYVTVSSTNPTIGEVTGDNVRVWAGSPLFGPERSTTPQGKLNKGDKVKIIGQPISNYYKIAVPSLPDAYYWVSTQYTKPLPKAVEVVRPIENSGVKPVVIKNPTEATPILVEKTTFETPEANNVVIDSNLATPVSTETVIQVTPLDKYYVLQKQVEEERLKPLNEQDYSAIKEALKEIVNDENAGKASKFSQSVIDRIEGIELALNVKDIVKKQNDKFKQNKESIAKAYTKKLEEVKNLGKYAVIGTLQNFLVFGSGNFRIVNDEDKTICYAVPSNSSTGKDYSEFVGKKVGLVGTIEPDIETSMAKVRFTNIELLK